MGCDGIGELFLHIAASRLRYVGETDGRRLECTLCAGDVCLFMRNPGPPLELVIRPQLNAGRTTWEHVTFSMEPLWIFDR